MARGRMISKAISLDEKINVLSDDTARLLFTWLIPHLDCEGRLHGDAQTVKSIIFPRRNISTARIEKYLNEFEKNGLIIRFTVNGNTYLFLPQFNKHQIGLQKDREAQSQIPTPPPELVQSNSRPRLSKEEVEVKIKVKTKVKEEVGKKLATTMLLGFEIEKGWLDALIEEYPGLDVRFEEKRCFDWWTGQRKTIKNAKSAMRNWCINESKFKAEKANNPAAKGGKTLPDTKTLKEAWK